MREITLRPTRVGKCSGGPPTGLALGSDGTTVCSLNRALALSTVLCQCFPTSRVISKLWGAFYSLVLLSWVSRRTGARGPFLFNFYFDFFEAKAASLYALYNISCINRISLSAFGEYYGRGICK